MMTPPLARRRGLNNQREDAEAAYAMILDNAEEWGVDTDRLGMIGFSAGAGLTMHTTLNSDTVEFIRLHRPDLWRHGPSRSSRGCSTHVCRHRDR